MRTDLMSMRHEAAFHLVVVGNAAAEMYRVAAARGLLFPATPVLSKSGRGRGGDQRDNQDKLASHDGPFWLRFRRPMGPGAVPPKQAANTPTVEIPPPTAAASVTAASVRHSTPQCQLSIQTSRAALGTPQANPASIARLRAPGGHRMDRLRSATLISVPPSAVRACRARRKCPPRHRAPS